MKRFLYTVVCVIALTSVILCGGCTSADTDNGQNNPLQSVNTAMGTIISQTIYLNTDNGEASANQNADTQDADTGNQTNNAKITDDILRTITDLEQKLLSWRLEISEIYSVNASAGREEGVVLSEELSEIMEKCLNVSEASGGAFDITIGEVVRLWDVDSWAGAEDVSGYTLPTDAELQKSLLNTGYEKLYLEENCLQLPEQMQIDLGAVGKGIALDELRELLEGDSSVNGAVVSVGGSVLTYGAKPDSTPWRVAVVNPNNPSANLGYLELHGTWCVSTSGDYERYVEIDGVRYHHIINPSTGYPADSGLAGVTILSKNGLLSDALSTACFVLGAEQGRELAEFFDAEALFVDREGHITMTEGMEQILRK